jgi:hypothetical protein
VVAITPDGRLYARHFRTSISSCCVIQALRYVRRKIGTPLLVIWDRLNAHRSRATTDELWRKLGDDGVRQAAYRGGCRACQNLFERAIVVLPHIILLPAASSRMLPTRPA